MEKPKTSLSIDDIKERLAPLFRKKEPQLVLLFGSMAKGGVHGKSDIDLGFLFDQPADVLALTNDVVKLLHSNRVDVVDLQRASPLLRFSAARTGTVLYERSVGLFNQFLSLAFRMYVDTKKLRDARRQMIRDFLKERDGMSPLEKEIIQRKIAIIIENLKALETIKDMAKEEYLADLYKRKATERLLQELIEAAIDINIHIISATGHSSPDDYYESFITMGKLNVISLDLADRLAPSAGLRNRLVHEYDRLDHAMVLDAVRMAHELYPRYIKEVSNYISKET